MPFPNLVASANWRYASLDGGLGGYPGFNWMIGARARPAYWDGHSIYGGTQAQFSAGHGQFWWYQSIEAGYELMTDGEFTLLVGGGIYVHIFDGKFSSNRGLVTPMTRLGLGWSFGEP